MRQTTQAVALLLTTANAALTLNTIGKANGVQGAATDFNVYQALPDQNIQSSSRTARYYSYKKLASNQLTWDTSTLKYQGGKMPPATTVSDAVSVAGSSCVKCINSGGVWCSRTFNYLLAATKNYQYLLGTAKAEGIDAHIADSDAKQIGGDYDQGSCCNTGQGMVELAGQIGVAGTISTVSYASGASAGQSNQAAGVPNVQRACIANLKDTEITTSGAVGFGTIKWENSTTAFTSWWCSNGLYKKVKTGGNGDANFLQIFNYNDNNRQELALVGCPQLADQCGAVGVKALTDQNAWEPTIAKSVTLGYGDKCTWIATSYKYAPTFTVAAGAGSLGITSLNWQLHTMEYTTNPQAFAPSRGSLSSQTGTANSGFLLGTEGANYNFIPRFDMPAAQFATLRTWYGLSENVMEKVSSASQYGVQYSSWFNPGNSGVSITKANSAFISAQGTQFYGNVAAIGTSKYVKTGSATNLKATDGNYGDAAGLKFDFRSVRYVPAATVQATYNTGSALATKYGQEVTSYNTAKTVWNNYVAILSKNAKMDAFAAAFSPPKAPTVPPLPNLPWTPADYTGFLKQTTLQAANFAYNTGAAFSESAQPGSNQFWTSLDAAQSIGGWGSWTAQIMTYRAGWGKSFGTIGFSPDTTMNYVWNNDWMCNSGDSQSNVLPCAPNKVTNAGSNAAPASTVANVDAFNVSGTSTSAQFVTAVTLWSIGDKATTMTDAVWNNKSDVKISFKGANWSATIPKLTAAITYSTKPTAADSLTGIAGAQALAVSSAAVLALAALY